MTVADYRINIAKDFLEEAILIDGRRSYRYRYRTICIDILSTYHPFTSLSNDMVDDVHRAILRIINSK